MGPIVTNYDRSNIGSALRSSANDRTTSLAYDKANRQVLEVNAAGPCARSATTRSSSSRPPRQAHRAHQAPRSKAAQPDRHRLRQHRGPVRPGRGRHHAGARDGHAQPNASQDRETTQILDGANRTVRTIDANGYATAREYDGTGQLTHLTEYADKSGSASAQDRHTRYSYDGAGRLASTTDALGNRETYAYNALGQKTAFTNKAGATWNYDYDRAGRLVRETSPAVDLAAVRSWAAPWCPMLATRAASASSPSWPTTASATSLRAPRPQAVPSSAAPDTNTTRSDARSRRSSPAWACTRQKARGPAGQQQAGRGCARGNPWRRAEQRNPLRRAGQRRGQPRHGHPGCQGSLELQELRPRRPRQLRRGRCRLRHRLHAQRLGRDREPGAPRPGHRPALAGRHGWPMPPCARACRRATPPTEKSSPATTGWAARSTCRSPWS